MRVDVVYHKSCQRMTELPDESIDMCLTSPPYFGLRDYGEDVREVWGGDPDCEHQWNFEQVIHDNLRFRGASSNVGNEKNKEIHHGNITNSGFCLKCGAWYGQLGLEPTFQLYLDHMMIVCAEIKRVLKKTGSFWLNMGDTYGGSCSGHGDTGLAQNLRRMTKGYLYDTEKPQRKIMPKCLLGIPSRLRNRLIDEQGWTCRNTVIWAKPNSMPSSKKDGLTPSYEFLFHFVKNIKPQYYWNKKTGLMADRKPKELKENIDWEWRDCSKCSGAGKIIQGIKAGDDDFGIVLSETGPEICPRCKGTGKIKHSFWHSLGYWYDLDAIREPHKDIQDYQRHAPFNYRVRETKKGHFGIIGVKSTREKMQKYDRKGIRVPGQISQGFHRKRHSGNYGNNGELLIDPRGKNPGDVWTIPTQPYPEAHFATFPDKLCIKPILATCPAEVCRKCRKARVRITKSHTTYESGSGKSGNRPKGKYKDLEGTGLIGKNLRMGPTPHVETIGWTDCGCNAGWDSGVLHDPFAGKGTALIMAKKLGRHYIGHELKKEYCEKLIKPALEEINPLFDYKKPGGAASAL